MNNRDENLVSYILTLPPEEQSQKINQIIAEAEAKLALVASIRAAQTRYLRATVSTQDSDGRMWGCKD